MDFTMPTNLTRNRRLGRSGWYAAVLGAAASLLSGAPALADDTEIFVNPNAATGVKPNLLLVLDTSGSMGSLVELERLPFDPTRTYEGDCRDDRLYGVVGAGATAPRCRDSDDRPEIRIEALRCSVAQATLARAGFWTGRALQFDEDAAAWSELPLEDEDAPVECEADAGSHGAIDASPRRYAQNGDANEPWTSREEDAIAWTAPVVTLYSGSYLNWLSSPAEPGTLTRLQVLQEVTKQLILSLDNIRVGIIRFSNNSGVGEFENDERAEGGMVVHEVADVSEARASLLQVIDNLTASGLTPLSETLYEAGQYWAGRPVDYGLNSSGNGADPLPSVAASRSLADPSRYRSPIESACQQNSTILFTDGEPRGDRSAPPRVESLPQYASVVGGACANRDVNGACLTEMAQYLFEADLSPSIPGEQSSKVYTIGFGPEVAGSSTLESVAEAGGGEAYSANSAADLLEAFQDIVRNVSETASTFTTPAVGINAFNRTQTLDELYVSVFQPSERLRWFGNLKKYRIEDGEIVDANRIPAIEPGTGFFDRNSESIWSETTDGNDVLLGGAANELPSADSRNIYTYIASQGNRNLAADENAVSVDNTLLTDELLAVAPDGYTREQIIGWVRGQDVRDLDGDGNTTETFRTLGDPLHARPALVSYGDDADPSDVVVLVPTNDGVLHAIRADDGEELWAFVAPELLTRLKTLVDNPPQVQRSYGLDGDVRVLKFDRNQNGIVEATDGDRVWAYFGMRRGGRQYYALDITNRARPELKFILGPSQLPGIGETWSTPALARVRVTGATQNGENLVLIFGGGYDAGQQNYIYNEDTVGNAIYMVDASSGALLWSASGPGNADTPDLELDRMTHSIPSRIVTIDFDGDQFADRMYAADMGGRVWRFDIFNGQAAGSLVTGGVFARLGGGDVTSPTRANTRRFYYAPDVSLIQRRGADPYYNLAIGSGYRGHPLETDTRDRFYSLRDKLPFTKLSQSQYNSLTPLVESDLINITDNPSTTAVPTTARGWLLELRLNTDWSGEKVLAESLTVGGIVLFPTYQPQPPAQVDPCSSANGVNRVYALSVDTGKPAIDFSGDATITNADLFTQIAQSGIAGEVTFAFEAVGSRTGQPGDDDDDDDESAVGVDALGRRAVCFVGVEVLRRCVLPGSVVRTFWQRVGAE
jgi:type IV pilus assembly protein PilY1